MRTNREIIHGDFSSRLPVMLRLLLMLLLLFPVIILAQESPQDFSNFTINDCINTPCQDIIVEGIDDQLSFVYVDCNCSLNAVFIPKGKAVVIKALTGTINVAKGTLISSGVQSTAVTNTFYQEALDELIAKNLGGISNEINGLSGTVCRNDQPLTIVGQPGEFYDFEISYAWLSSTDNISFERIEGATEKDFTPPPLEVTTYYKRQVYSSISTGTFSNVYTVNVTDCENIDCQIQEVFSIAPAIYASPSYTITETVSLDQNDEPIGRLFIGGECNTDLPENLRLHQRVEGLPDGLLVNWTYPKVIDEEAYWELTLNGTPTVGSSGTYTISVTIDNSFIGNDFIAERNETTSITTAFKIIVNPKPIVPTPIHPTFLSSLLTSDEISDNIGQVFIGIFKSSTSSSSLQEGTKFYELKHKRENEN